VQRGGGGGWGESTRRRECSAHKECQNKFKTNDEPGFSACMCLFCLCVCLCGSETASKVVFCMSACLYFGACNFAEKCVRRGDERKGRGRRPPKNKRVPKWEREFPKQVQFYMRVCVGDNFREINKC